MVVCVGRFMAEVNCADCGVNCPAWIEDEETRMKDHDGIWADCPDCGITGYNHVVSIESVQNHDCEECFGNMDGQMDEQVCSCCGLEFTAGGFKLEV